MYFNPRRRSLKIRNWKADATHPSPREIRELALSTLSQILGVERLFHLQISIDFYRFLDFDSQNNSAQGQNGQNGQSETRKPQRIGKKPVPWMTFQ